MSSFTHPAGADEPAILARFGIGADALLGSGGESRVFALDAHRVLRVGFGLFDRIEPLRTLVDGFATVDLGVATPHTLDRGRVGGQEFTIDERIPGESLAAWLRRPRPERERRRVLLELLDVAARLRLLPLPPVGFGHPVFPERAAPDGSLVGLLRTQADLGERLGGGLLATVVPDLDRRKDELFAELAERSVEPALVHGDYYPGNVMIEGDRISGVIDFSVHSLIADPVMDEVGAVCLLEHETYRDAAADSAWLGTQLAERLGEQAWLIDAYRRWYGLYYSMDERLIDWAAGLFRRPLG